jgi:competence protein ComGC
MLKNNNGYTLFEILVLMGVSVLTCLIVWLIVGLGRFLWSL